ncbi:hypothetical protein BUALT_Bualt07G0061000 [Buddleja alternifolia]|uniref:Fe2OG dioxygenase domain-containing protein n=1 Tax=Buddleja alternifolia TaxID=168488 RepID=A0AAV6X8Q7_9LAMI|nr:hypothetical protein BUALT_Bualt07G0061000 [Buddleja alternifolia]
MLKCIYVSVFGDERGKEVALAGLKSKAKYVRSELGKRMKLRLTPEIRFLEDESIERGSRIERTFVQVMANSVLPTVDLSAYFNQGDEDGKKKAMLEIEEACSEYGFFLAVNHGVPLELMSRALQVSKSFFELPDQEKLKYSFKPGSSPPQGFLPAPDDPTDRKEHLFMVPPYNSDSNYCPPAFQQILKDMFHYLSELGFLVESIINDCLGLPRDFLKEYNNNRSWDFIVSHHYFPAPETGYLEKTCHTDGNMITFVFTNGVEGLEVYKDGKWIPITPPDGSLVVNVGDIIQVMSNDKFKSAIHRVVRPRGRSRYSYAFFYSVHGDKLVEPLPHFTIKKGESPKYKGFLYKEYAQLRLRNRTHPPASPEDLIGINHYAITNS